MDTKLVTLIAAAAALLGSAMGANVFGQATELFSIYQRHPLGSNSSGGADPRQDRRGAASVVARRLVRPPPQDDAPSTPGGYSAPSWSARRRHRPPCTH